MAAGGIVAVITALAGSCGATSSPQGASGGGDGRRVTSNVLPGDYAGSAACAPCHGTIAGAFDASPMHRMTRGADDAIVHGPFDGTTLRVADDVATMLAVDGQRYVHTDSVRRGRRLYRITEIIGGRYREDYVGIRVAGMGDRDRPLADPPTRLILPVSWMIGDGEWRYKGYSVQVRERPGLAAGPVWNRTCIFCHNTPPTFSTLFDQIATDRLVYQGSTPSNLLPEDRRLRYRITDPDGLVRALADEITRLGEAAPDPAATSVEAMAQRAGRVTRERFTAAHLVELGIGCEVCHGGSREHVRSPGTLPSHLPQSPLFAVEAEEGELGRAGAINHSCARCHSVLFSRYPHTWEGGSRDEDPGGSTINSGEARNFLLGGCARAMSCTTCHDPHGEDDPQHLAWLATPAGNVTCTPCHQELATDGALRAHAHHPPTSAGASCVGCHMPRKNAGLAYSLTRYHRIGRPNDPSRVERDRPVECALCHLDGSVEELVGAMERWWGTRHDRSALRRLYGGDLSVNVLEATLRRGKPHEQVAAIERLGRTGDRRYLPLLVGQLAHEYPLVRYYARESIMRITGEQPPLDMSRPGDELRRDAARWSSDHGLPEETDAGDVQ